MSCHGTICNDNFKGNNVIYALGTRGFSRVRRELSVLAEGRHVFGRRPKPRAAKDLTETGNRARKVSGTQGMLFNNIATIMLNYIALKIVFANLPMCHFNVAHQTGLVLCRMIRASLWTHKHLCPLRAESMKYILLSSPKLKVVFFKRHSDRKAAISPSRAQSVQVIDIMSHTWPVLKFGWNCGL